eukprot:12391258-Prorocentrum_lima.AAC.1
MHARQRGIDVTDQQCLAGTQHTDPQQAGCRRDDTSSRATNGRPVRTTRILTTIVTLLLITAGGATNQEQQTPNQPHSNQSEGSTRPTIQPLHIIDMMTMD